MDPLWQRNSPALIVVHESLGEFAAVLQATEIVHSRVDPTEAFGILAGVGHAGSAFALFERGDVNVMRRTEHGGLVGGVHLVVIERKLPAGPMPGVEGQQRRSAMVAVGVD